MAERKGDGRGREVRGAGKWEGQEDRKRLGDRERQGDGRGGEIGGGWETGRGREMGEMERKMGERDRREGTAGDK